MLVQEPSAKLGGYVGITEEAFDRSLCHLPPSLTSLPSDSEEDNLASSWESAVGFLKKVHMDGQLELGLFVMLNPGDLLTGFGLLPHFTNTIRVRESLNF